MSKKKLLTRVGEVIRLKHYSITMPPVSLVEPLQSHLTKVRALHKRDVRDGFGGVYLPFAREKNYPHAGREWGWRYEARWIRYENTSEV